MLDRTQRVYGSYRRLPIYVDEYGYITNRPNHSGHFVSPRTAATYINWAEYLSYKNPRVATTMQFLLEDPNPRVGVPEFGGFASGLEFFKRKHKPSYDAYRMPLFLPTTTAKRGQALEVSGCVRPATGARQLTHESQQVSIQFQRNQSGPFTTIKVVPITNARGYFDVRLKFPASGSVRLEWTRDSDDRDSDDRDSDDRDSNERNSNDRNSNDRNSNDRNSDHRNSADRDSDVPQPGRTHQADPRAAATVVGEARAAGAVYDFRVNRRPTTGDTASSSVAASASSAAIRSGVIAVASSFSSSHAAASAALASSRMTCFPAA